MLLVMSICIQINTIKTATKNVGTTIKDNSDLKDELLSCQGKYESLYKELENKERELEKARLNASTKNETDARK